ncbi:MAG: hypothetical protein JXP73_05800 [Deltaproteobacteria bacterium]|nr:hypothetical protein [Deltaproteobacteria bacterium]
MSESTTTAPRWDPGLIHALLDELAAVYAGAAYQREIAAAREEYFTRSGKVFEDDAEVYEARTLSFLEWYVIERPLVSGQTPILDALGKMEEESQSTRRSEALAGLASSHRSVFDIAGVDGNVIELEDVLGGARFCVVERRGTVGFEVGALVEARVVWDGEQPVFGKTFLFHPRDARTEILDFVDEAVAGDEHRDEIMFHLARLYLRWHRHGHSNAARIYKGGGTAGPVPL